MEEENVVVDNSNTTEEELELDLTLDTEPNLEEDTASKLAKAEELAKNYKIRAEKAEKLAREKKEVSETTTPKPDSLSSKDLYALMQAQVPQDDIEEVERAAKVMGVSVAEALKSSVVKGILQERAELRTTAEATSVANQRRSPAKLSDDALINSAKAGKLPENDDDIQRLMRAKMFEGREKK